MMIDDLLDEMSKTFGGIAKIERDFTGLLRKSPDDEPVELVHSTLVPGTNWRVNSHENIVRMTSEIKQLRRTLIQASIILGFIMAVPISWAARRVSRSYENKIEQQNADLDKERKKSDELLLNVLPPSIANRLKRGENVIADRHESVSVLFADLVGFTTIASKVEPEKVVEKLNVLFTEFDSICEKHGVEKIKTIGDAYMAVSGLLRKQDNHARVMLEVAREMNECMKKLARQSGEDLAVRIGIHSGPIVAGVIGKAKFSYDLWGDTVNTASRMESHGVSGRIHVSNTVYNLTSEFFTFDACGEVQIKGKGKMQTYLLNDNNAE
jgi:class 3 adenylate cyclase